MAELLMKISWILFALAVIALMSTVAFWVKFKIPKIIGDLSGRTAKKTIAKMRSDNEKTGKMTLRPQITGLKNGRGRYPTIMHQSPPGTAGPATVRNSRHAPVTLQAQAGQTGLLADNRAESSINRSEETTMLSNAFNMEEMGQGATTLLAETERQHTAATADRNSVQLEMLDDDLSVHTDEVIP